MSYCKEVGKDRIIYVTKEDHEKPTTVQLSEPDPKREPPRGLILPNGEINWGCPCLGGMASGPCGYEFRDAFSCFHNSTEEVKGSDCVEKFGEMQACMARYPNLYPKSSDEDDDDEFLKSLEEEEEAENEALTEGERGHQVARVNDQEKESQSGKEKWG